MSFQPSFPPSLLARVPEEDADTKKRSKEEYRKMKELEEARKSATVPAMKDEEGRDINPHIPQYIMQAPWYYGSLKPTLTHQRMQEDEKASGSTMLTQWYKRGVKDSDQMVTKFRKGACDNCGSMTHKKRDCFERPRKLGAKQTGDNIAPDEYVQPDLQLGFEGKRDRWNGYDPREHRRLVDEFQRLEEARKLVKAKQIDDSLTDASFQEAAAGSQDKDEDKYGDELDMPGQKFDSKQRQSIRNLRIREDTAKYLYNLDPNSAYYDPKTRSMRDNPFGDKPEHEVPYAGDNVDRFAGDTMGMMQSQVFAWQMHGDRGLNVHLQADPTRLELLRTKVSEAHTEVRSNVKEDILERYGGREHLDVPARELLMAQSEAYVEYSRTGQVVRGAEKPKVLSKYEEDVFINNHTNVWGSYWCNGQWGFRCCHSTIKESYCTGESGKEAALVPALPPPPPPVLSPPDPPKAGEKRKLAISTEDGCATPPPSVEETKSKKKKRHSSESSSSSSSSSDTSDSSSDSSSESSDSPASDSDDDDKQRKKRSTKRKSKSKKKKKKTSGKKRKELTEAEQIKAAIAKELTRQRSVDKMMRLDERKRGYNSHYEVKQPTELEMEAFHRTKLHPDDPMNKIKSMDKD